MQKVQVIMIALCLFFSQGNGRLVYKGQVKYGVGGVDGLKGASCVVVSPDGRQVYAAGPENNTIAWFSRDSISGACSYLGKFNAGVTSIQGVGVYEIAVSSSGNEVYAMGYDASIAWFSRNASTGDLTYKGVLTDNHVRVTSLRYANSFALSSDGKQCYVAKATDSAEMREVTMSWFNRSPTDGSLTAGGVFKDNVNRLYDASWLCISSDDKTVYATAALDLSISWFNRNGSTGALSYGGTLKDGMNGMSGALGVTTSGDGKNVYIASVFSSALVWFTRIPSTGQLIYGGFFQGSTANNNTGKDTCGMNGAWTTVVSPNGKHIYVASILSCAITSFSRDTVTGTPTFEQTIKGIPGLGGPTCVAVAPRGKHVYVSACDDNTISWFEEDFATPTLVRSPSNETHPSFVITKQAGGIDASYTIGPNGDNHVKLVVMTLDGRIIRDLFKGFNAPGTHRYAWNFRSGSGCRVSPGVYLCALTTAANGTTVRSINVGK